MNSASRRLPRTPVPLHDLRYGDNLGYGDDHQLAKPLVEYCTNEWRKSPSHESSPDRGSESDDFMDRLEDFVEATVAVITAPKFKRLLLVIVIVTITSTVLWIKVLSPMVRAERETWASVNKNVVVDSEGVFGSNGRPDFPGMIQVQHLDPKLLPRSKSQTTAGTVNKNRLVFVGDIHGCREELEALLEKLHFDPATDHLIATGDIVNKGPDSRGVIDLLRGYKASCVRGNHDDRLLLVVNDLHSTSLSSKKNPKLETSKGGQAISDASDEVRTLAMSLDADQIKWLKSCPLILRVGELKAFNGETVVVHGGLVPGIPLEQQDPSSVMNIRILDLETHVPSKQHEQKGSVPWYQLWNKYQDSLALRQRVAKMKSFGRAKIDEKQMTVIYGHDAKKALQIHKYSKGLDSGCVRGDRLTALVVSGDGTQEIVQVDCKDWRKRPPVHVDVDTILRNGRPGPPVNDVTD
ncbi:protein phosphatase [Exophiala viscosa]|uniref:Protein phosphatase n=1 Tax=Exophiala viscosa TaxID=2486360 RepID=A0AAN6E2E2_9EURO|nr:protein phosphatase [Exophiala viscosa]